MSVPLIWFSSIISADSGVGVTCPSSSSPLPTSFPSSSLISSVLVRDIELTDKVRPLTSAGWPLMGVTGSSGFSGSGA